MNKNNNNSPHRDRVLNQEPSNTQQLLGPCAATFDNEIPTV